MVNTSLLRRGFLASAILASAAAASAGQQREIQSLKDMARSHGGKTRVVVDVDLPRPTLRTVVDSAEVIVQGKIVKVEPRLTRDEELIFTYVTLAPTVFLKSSDRDGRTLRQPDVPAPVVFIEPGGTVHADGLEMIVGVSSAAEPPLQVGEEVIAFLARGDDPVAFQLAASSFGLFRVYGDKVAHTNKSAASRRPLASNALSDFHGAIRDQVSAGKH